MLHKSCGQHRHAHRNVSFKGSLWGAGVFPRGLGQVSKVRQQIKHYVAGQLDACTQPDPEHPKAHFEVTHPSNLAGVPDPKSTLVR